MFAILRQNHPKPLTWEGVPIVKIGEAADYEAAQRQANHRLAESPHLWVRTMVARVATPRDEERAAVMTGADGNRYRIFTAHVSERRSDRIDRCMKANPALTEVEAAAAVDGGWGNYTPPVHPWRPEED